MLMDLLILRLLCCYIKYVSKVRGLDPLCNLYANDYRPLRQSLGAICWSPRSDHSRLSTNPTLDLLSLSFFHLCCGLSVLLCRGYVDASWFFSVLCDEVFTVNDNPVDFLFYAYGMTVFCSRTKSTLLLWTVMGL